MRWAHPDLGQLTPNLFLDIIESDNLARDFLEYSIKAIAADAKTLVLPEGARIGINVSPNLLVSRHAATWILDIAKKAELPAQKVTIEITERLNIPKSQNLALNVSQLRLAGFSVALDDFGTGNSSLVRLYRMPFDVMKIDQLFVRGTIRNEDALNICRILAQCAKLLKRKSIAEGIETEEILQKAKEAGIDIGQGYLWSKPVPLSAFNNWVSNRKQDVWGI